MGVYLPYDGTRAKQIHSPGLGTSLSMKTPSSPSWKHTGEYIHHWKIDLKVYHSELFVISHPLSLYWDLYRQQCALAALVVIE